MRYDDGRLWVQIISTQAFAHYMEYRGETNRSLAAKATEVLRKRRSSATVGHAIVGHLRRGERTSCSHATATALEEALNAPPNSLFVVKVANGHMVASRRRSDEAVPA